MFRTPPPYLWTPLSPQRVKGCSPLTIPKKKSKPKNASRFAKRIFLCFSHLRLRRRFYLSAELYALRGPNTSCGAANRRNEKKALSAATSFFPFRLLLWGLKGASSPFLVGPARRNRWWFSGSLLTSKENLAQRKSALPRAQAREAGAFLVLFWHAKENLAQRKSALTPRHRRAIPLKLNQNTLPTAYKHFTRSSRYSGSLGSRLLMTTPPLAAAPVEWIYRPSPR